MSHTTLSRLPAIGVVLAVVFLVLSAARYPGGYDWTRHFISTLFAGTTPSGDPNPARPLAVIGMLLFCAGIALLFQILSSKANSSFHRKTIQIAGIGSMVYALLAVTPMHDLMVTIALIFFLTAMFAVLHMLYIQRDLRLLSLGLLCLAILLSCAVMYYGNVLLVFLPVMQKVTFATCVGWLFAVQFANRRMKSGQNDPV